MPAWGRVDAAGLLATLQGLFGSSPTRLVLVDGRSGAGKTTWAERIAGLLGDSVVVHTDDVAWNHDAYGWDDLLVRHIVEPWRRREPVSYVPPGWAKHHRPGAIDVPVVSTLVVEGVGAGRRELAREAQATIWVHSDRDVARRRGIGRDIELGRTREEASDFWDEWMRREDPFQDESRPWSRADLVIRGNSDDALGDGFGYVRDGPLGPDPDPR